MRQKTSKSLSPDEMADIAVEFENREFSPEELRKIAATRRSTPRPAKTALGGSGVGGS